MAGRGNFDAITPEQMKSLLAIRYESDLNDDECDEAITEEVSRIEETIRNSPYFHDVDKAWDPIHRCLTGDQTPDGMVNPDAGRGPLKLCVLGGVELTEADHRFIITLVKPDQVPQLARALARIDKASLRKRFFRIDPKAVSYYPIDGDEFEYTWSNFAGLPAF